MNHFLFKTPSKIKTSVKQPLWQRFNDAFKDTIRSKLLWEQFIFLSFYHDRCLWLPSSATVNLLLAVLSPLLLHLQLLSCCFRLSCFNTRPLIIFGLITSAWTGGALEIMTWCIFNKLTETANGNGYPMMRIHLCTENLCKDDLQMFLTHRHKKTEILLISGRQWRRPYTCWRLLHILVTVTAWY